jgi:hypothetical protein
VRSTYASRADASQAVEEAQRTERVAADKTTEAFAHVRLWSALSLMAGAMAAGNLGIAESVERCYTGEVRFTLNRCLCREQAVTPAVCWCDALPIWGLWWRRIRGGFY